MKEVFECFTKNYCNFEGRASRKEYWLFYLVTGCFSLLLQLFGLSFVSLLLIIPGFAVTVRRLHDTGRKAWFLLLPLIPIVGSIWLLVILCLRGKKGPNTYGEEPKSKTALVKAT